MAGINRLLSYIPEWLQNELKRVRYRHLISKGKFITPEPEFNQLSKFLKEGDWAIDIGANIGHYTLEMSSLVGNTGRIIAFEPIPQTFSHLASNVLNSAAGNITLFNAAVSESSSIVAMSMPDFDSGMKNYYQAAIKQNVEENDVKVLTLSIEQLNLHHKISLIKIDAEGHEPYVIKGLLDIVEKDKPVLIIETVTDEMREHLLAIGYTEQKNQNSPNCVFFADT